MELVKGEAEDPTIPTAMRCAVFESLMATLYAKILRTCCLKHTAQSDVGYGLVWFDETGQRPGVFCDAEAAHMQLSFFGPLSLCPTTGCFRVATFDHIPIYMRSPLPLNTSKPLLRARSEIFAIRQ